jgi:hypothetical protein
MQRGVRKRTEKNILSKSRGFIKAFRIAADSYAVGFKDL